MRKALVLELARPVASIPDESDGFSIPHPSAPRVEFKLGWVQYNIVVGGFAAGKAAGLATDVAASFGGRKDSQKNFNRPSHTHHDLIAVQMSGHLDDYPLDTARKEIRLLTIVPALSSKARIKCSLQVASLDAFPRYEAISYVWGDIQEKQDILLDGRTIQVPTNVRRILHRLRHRKQRRVIWIDYVCIDQENVAEKNTQVPLMSAIYANATSVLAIISLDNLSGNATDAIDWMKTADMEKGKRKEACWRVNCILSQISMRYERRLAVSLRNVVSFYLNFLFAGYWTRMWTFQEYQLSQGKPPICICGDVEFPAPDESAFGSAYIALLRRLSEMSMAEERGRRPQLRNHYEEIERLSRKFQVTLSKVSYMWVSDRQEFFVQGLLRQTSGRKCQNPKDKIYALYGLLPSLREAYPPDYNKSLSQVIFETAKYILNKEPGGFSMLNIFCLRDDRLENVSIPSWVPDLTTTYLVSTGTLGLHSERFGIVYKIRGTVPRRYPKITKDHSVLSLSGRPIGKCRSVFQFASDVKSVLAQIMGVIHMHGDGCYVWNNVWEPQNIPLRFLQGCCVFSSHSYIKLEWSSLKSLRTVFETLDLVHQDADTVLETFAEAGFEFLRDLVPRLYNIEVFTIHHMSSVSFGFSEQSVKKEDQVFVNVSQFNMPFVLRHGCGTDYNRGQVYHKLVGFAYVDGICRGAVKSNPYLNYVCTVPHENILLS
ncbi:heterokaryon incompatibility protein-domain-containing protein [Aspergillus minisclerotigenes]|uniref:Heterokaryon incompatibility protein-domain-containing protein n=1 Tax=Aspergillus minisclerotigenes TaxID=656917 RepID=A0A5N6IVC9_9EURO|nr:heterokaryon incompatibility protein-domain-containing protein [Aspergillus minisclerotigenes]